MRPAKTKKAQEGLSLYLALMIMIFIISVSLGISVIIITQLKIIRGIEDSVIALSAADTGIERVLYEDKLCRQLGCDFVLPGLCVNPIGCDAGRMKCFRSEGCIFSGNIGSGSYQADFNDGALSITSVGSFKGTKRAVQVTR